MHASDLVTLPKRKEKVQTRKPLAKVPDWHLTGSKTMKYINEAKERQEEIQNTRKSRKKLFQMQRKQNENLKKSDPLANFKRVSNYGPLVAKIFGANSFLSKLR